MKRICRAVVFAALAVMLLVPQLAWASNNDFDSGDDQNVALSLSSDKSSYEEGERAEIKLTIENSGGSDLGEVAYTFKLPEEMVATEGSSLAGAIDNIGAGESTEITLNADVVSPSPSSQNAQSDGPTKLAQTGDTLLLVVSFGLFLLLFSGMLLVWAKKRKAAPLLLLVPLCLGVSVFGFSQVSWASDETLSTALAVTVNGKEAVVAASVGYKTQAVDINDKKLIARDQWISDLMNQLDVAVRSDVQNCPFTDIGDSEYEDAIKTAWALGWFDELDGESETLFRPTQPTTRDFALSTSVLALGFSGIGGELSVEDANDALNPGLLSVAIDLGLIAPDDNNRLKPKDVLSDQDEASLLAAIARYVANRNHDSGTGIVYRPDVVVINDYAIGEDGSYQFDREKYSVSEGSKVAFVPNDDNPKGSAGVVTEDVDSAVAIEQASSLEEIFESVSIHETAYSSDLSQVEFADGVTVVDEPRLLAEGSVEEKLSIKVKFPLDEAEVQVKFTPGIRMDLEWTALKGFSRLDVALLNELSVEVSGDIKAKYERDLTKTPIPVYVGGGVYVGVTPVFKCSASGTISVEFEVSSEAGVVVERNHIGTYWDSSIDAKAKLEGKLSASISPYLFATLLSIEVVDFQLDVGVQGTADAELRPTGLLCENIKANPFATITCGKNTNWMKSLNLSLDKKLMTEKNCPENLRLVLHFENEQLVPECTWDPTSVNPDKPEDPSVPEQGDGDGGKGAIPEIEDNGYSDVPVLADLSGSTSYYNKLVEPFNVNAGKSVTIGASRESAVAIGFDCAPGTIYRLTERSWTGEVESSELNAFVSSARPWYGDTIYCIEVLCGRVTVTEITAWNPPTVSIGACEGVEYPFSLSDSAVSMKPGATYDMKYAGTLDSLFGSKYSDLEPVWSSSDASIVSVDESGHLTALGEGRATITASLGGSSGFKRCCEVTVGDSKDGGSSW